MVATPALSFYDFILTCDWGRIKITLDSWCLPNHNQIAAWSNAKCIILCPWLSQPGGEDIFPVFSEALRVEHKEGFTFFVLPTIRHQPVTSHWHVPFCCHQDLSPYDVSITMIYFNREAFQALFANASGQLLFGFL